MFKTPEQTARRQEQNSVETTRLMKEAVEELELLLERNHRQAAGREFLKRHPKK